MWVLCSTAVATTSHSTIEGTMRVLAGADPGFFEEGAHQIKDRNFRTCGDKGCLTSETKKKCNFQGQFAQFGAFFLPEAPAKERGCAPPAPPYKSTPDSDASVTETCSSIRVSS